MVILAIISKLNPNHIIIILLIIVSTILGSIYLIKDSNKELKIEIKEFLSIEVKNNKQILPKHKSKTNS